VPVSVIASRLRLHVPGWVLNLLSVHARRLRPSLRVLGWMLSAFVYACPQAEAECAWLDAEGLVEGCVTDDNDVFLFGGRHVYRNIFADKK